MSFRCVLCKQILPVAQKNVYIKFNSKRFNSLSKESLLQESKKGIPLQEQLN